MLWPVKAPVGKPWLSPIALSFAAYNILSQRNDCRGTTHNFSVPFPSLAYHGSVGVAGSFRAGLVKISIRMEKPAIEALGGQGQAQTQDALRRVSELKRELRKLVHLITDDDECRIGLFDEIAQTLAAFKDAKFSGGGGSRTLSERLDSIAVPEHFLCPISSELMRDPVILATGQTYDRAFIQAWLQAGHRTCPKTQQVLPHLILTPNYLVRNMIEQWCEAQGLEGPRSTPAAAAAAPPDPSSDGITAEERRRVGALLDQAGARDRIVAREAVRELRLLTRKKPSHRVFLAETRPPAIPLLISLLESSDPETQEHAVTTLLNLSIHDPNKTAIADQEAAIPAIVEVLRSCGAAEGRGNAAAALFSLSAVDDNKARIGAAPGAIPALVDLLRDGTPPCKKDSASALFNLCVQVGNRIRTIEAGVVPVLLKLVASPGEGMVDEALAILAIVATVHEGAEAIGSAGSIPCLMGLIRDASVNPRNKENAAVILHAVCANDRSYVRELRDDLVGFRALIDLSENGTSRARRKAAAILDRMKKLLHSPTM